jgi:hypothetical protein
MNTITAAYTENLTDPVLASGEYKAYERFAKTSWYERGAVGAVYNNRSRIATVLSMAACYGSIGLGCVAAIGTALLIRNEQRDGLGFSDADAADAVLTIATLGMVKAPAALATRPAANGLDDGVAAASGVWQRAAVTAFGSGAVGASQATGCLLASENSFCVTAG